MIVDEVGDGNGCVPGGGNSRRGQQPMGSIDGDWWSGTFMIQHDYDVACCGWWWGWW